LKKRKENKELLPRMNPMEERRQSNHLFVEAAPVWYSQNGKVNSMWLSACKEERTLTSHLMERIADSCGHGVPLMRYEGDRSQIPAWADNRLRKQGPDALVQYQAEKNLTSIDGLAGLDTTLLDISNTPVDRP